jgi:hypothetical protein
VHLLLFCTMTNKCTIISQIISLLHVSTISCHPQGACNQYLAKLHKYFKVQIVLPTDEFEIFAYNLARYWLQAPWGWHDSAETCSSVIICEIIVHLLVIGQNKQSVFRCSAWIKNNSNFRLLNWSVFITETDWIHCAVRSGSSSYFTLVLNFKVLL